MALSGEGGLCGIRPAGCPGHPACEPCRCKARSRAIIKGRPYACVDDLMRKKVLRRTAIEKIKHQVTVR